MTSIQSRQTLSASTAALTSHQAPPPDGTPLALVQPPAREQPQPSQPNAADLTLKRALGDQCDWQTLAQQLNQAAQYLAPQADAQAVASVLAETRFKPHPDASYYQKYDLDVGATVDLESFLSAWRATLPTTRTELITLARAATDQSMQHPFGNFGGALSWPFPLNLEHQETIHALIASNSAGLTGLPLIDSRRGALGYLINDRPLSEAELQDPAKALERLLLSPRAQALGQTLQTRLNGIATETSVNDYVLAGIQLGLDAESISAPDRNKVAGFDLAQKQHWGQSPASVVSALSSHLVNNGKTSAATAKLGTHLLLGRVAPQFLVKDIPENVVYGSQSWTNLCLAVAKIEANTPGATPNMNFAQVMSSAHASDTPIPEETQKSALIDWGVANGIVERKDDNLYSSVEIERVRDDFNRQLEERATASNSLGRPLPNLKEIALAKLEEQFGKGVPFEEKCITADYAFKVTRHHQGTYSMLDIAMMGQENVPKWKTTDSRIPIDALNSHTGINVFNTFKHQFDETITAKKKGLGTTVQHLITQLPLADRENLERGKIDFYQDKVYTLATDFYSPPALTSKSSKLLIKTERNAVTTLYEIDLEKGAIHRLTDLQARTRMHDFRNANKLHKTEILKPAEGAPPGLQGEAPTSALPPQSFSSQRTRYIADTFIEAFDLDNADILKQARGVTTFDQELASRERVHEFLLNLVPLRSAIVNFRDGNYVDGAMDLGMDLFGFLTAGAGAAAKVGKVVATGASSVAKALKTARIVGVTAIESFNPLSGVGDLAIGVGRLAIKGTKGVTTKIQTLRGAADSYDLVAASQKYEAAATGTFTFSGHYVEGAAVRKNGHWYAYDADKMQAYGSPLEAFSPTKTLMPPSPTLRVSNRHHEARYNPLSRINRPAATPRIPLPLDEYVTSPITNGALIDDHFTPNRIKLTREKFTLEKNGFFQEMAAGNMPPRPTLPDITDTVPINQLFAEALEKTDVLVLGERHTEVASLIAMRDAMKTFKESGVTAIFVEGATLDAYGLINDRTLAYSISKRPGGGTLYEELKKAADEFEIEIMPLEHRYLTRHSDTPHYFGGLETLPRSSPAYAALSKQRLEEVNYYGAKQVLKNELGGKSVVWVGRSHMSTTEGIPGIAELTGGIGIGVYQKADITQSVGRRAGGQRDTAAALSTTDVSVGDLQIDVKV